MFTRICKVCKTPFQAKHPHECYCSVECVRAGTKALAAAYYTRNREKYLARRRQRYRDTGKA
jgi:hypothetical protein